MSESLRLFLSNPIVGHAVGVAGIIIGAILSFYFYKKGTKRHGLTYKISETRTQIVKAGEASQLSVLHNGQEIKGDIMAVHVAIWNQGRESICQQDMRRPLIIETKNNTPILEAKILKTKPDVVELFLDQSKCPQGQLNISWNLLEEHDGGIVQLIYEGPVDLEITAHAIPKGSIR